MKSFSEWVIEEVAGGGIVIGDVLLKIKKDTEWNEYIVQWIENGVLNDDKSYHAGGDGPEERADAIGTMNDMANRERERQANSV